MCTLVYIGWINWYIIGLSSFTMSEHETEITVQLVWSLTPTSYYYVGLLFHPRTRYWEVGASIQTTIYTTCACACAHTHTHTQSYYIWNLDQWWKVGSRNQTSALVLSSMKAADDAEHTGWCMWNKLCRKEAHHAVHGYLNKRPCKMQRKYLLDKCFGTWWVPG